MSKRKITRTADEISQAWGSNLKSAVPKMQAGVDRVDVNPCEEAVKQQDKMKANLVRSIDEGRWANGLSKVSKTDWQSVTKAKISSNLASGVDSSMPKRRKFDSWLVSTLNTVLPEIADMPSMTTQDNINKAVAYMTSMSQHKYKSER